MSEENELVNTTNSSKIVEISHSDAKRDILDINQFDVDATYIMAILQDGASEAVQKRQILNLFDRFKHRYAELSVKLRNSVLKEQHLIEKVDVFFYESWININLCYLTMNIFLVSRNEA